MLARAFIFVSQFVAISLSHFIESLVVREPMTELNCNEQLIRLGKLLAGYPI